MKRFLFKSIKYIKAIILSFVATNLHAAEAELIIPDPSPIRYIFYIPLIYMIFASVIAVVRKSRMATLHGVIGSVLFLAEGVWITMNTSIEMGIVPIVVSIVFLCLNFYLRKKY